jgi:hypothetical protein
VRLCREWADAREAFWDDGGTDEQQEAMQAAETALVAAIAKEKNPPQGG